MTEERRIVREVATAVGLAEGERGVRTVLATLARLEPVSTRRISRAAELPVPIVAAVCGELRKRSVVADERPTQLTAAGRELFAGGSLRIGRPSCAGCGGRGVVVPGELSPLVRELSKAVRGGPPARLELDQCHCTVDTKLRRLLAVHEAGALVGRRVLLLGDDDLTGLALHLLVKHHGSASTIASLAIVDVDPALISFLACELAEAPFPVTCVEHDLREPLPPGSSAHSTRSSPTRPTRPRRHGSFSRVPQTRSPTAAATCSSRTGRGDPVPRRSSRARSSRSAS